MQLAMQIALPKYNLEVYGKLYFQLSNMKASKNLLELGWAFAYFGTRFIEERFIFQME